MRIAVGLSVLLCSLVAPTARATVDDTPPTVGEDASRTGFYFGVGAGFAFENFTFDSDNLGMTGILGPGVDPGFDDSQGAHVQLGYRVHRRVGLDFLYEFLEGFDSTRGTPDTEIDSHLFMFNVKLYPCEGRLQPYVLGGIGARLINSEVRDKSVKKPFETDAGFTGRLGGGLAFAVTRHFVVELEGAYQLGTGGIVQYADYGSLGVHFIYRR